MIIVAFVLFVVMILAWLVAPDRHATSTPPDSYWEASARVVGEPAT